MFSYKRLGHILTKYNRVDIAANMSRAPISKVFSTKENFASLEGIFSIRKETVKSQACFMLIRSTIDYCSTVWNQQTNIS